MSGTPRYKKTSICKIIRKQHEVMFWWNSRCRAATLKEALAQVPDDARLIRTESFDENCVALTFVEERAIEGADATTEEK